jgi:DNA primase
VVASLGTALTERQVQVLKRLTTTVVLALDADSAGDEAMMRGLEVARQVYGDAQVAVPLPQGLVRLESRLAADLRIAALPRGEDPDEIIRQNPDNWSALVGGARSVVDYYFDVVLSRADLKSTKGTTTAIRQLLPIIGEVRDPVQRALYLQRLSERVHIAEQVLASELARLRLASPAVPSNQPESTEETLRRRSTLDEYTLGLILRYPNRSRALLDELREDDWELVESREVFLEICRQIADGRQPDAAALARDLPEPLVVWLQAVLRSEEYRPVLDDRALAVEQPKAVADMRRRLRRAKFPAFVALLRDLEQSVDDSGAALVHSQVERELAQLEAQERQSSRARVWTSL